MLYTKYLSSRHKLCFDVMKNSDDLSDFDKLAISLEGGKEPVEVLDAAQQLEMSAKMLYEKLERGTQNQSMKSLFSFLAKEEQHHYDLLEKLQLASMSVRLARLPA